MSTIVIPVRNEGRQTTWNLVARVAMQRSSYRLTCPYRTSTRAIESHSTRKRYQQSPRSTHLDRQRLRLKMLQYTIGDLDCANHGCAEGNDNTACAEVEIQAIGVDLRVNKETSDDMLNVSSEENAMLPLAESCPPAHPA